MGNLSKSERSWQRTFAVLQALCERDRTRTELIREARRRVGDETTGGNLAVEDADFFSLRRDLDRLRRVFQCKVVFLRRSRTYHLEDVPLPFALTEDEMRALAVVRDLTEKTSPVLSGVGALLQRILASSGADEARKSDAASALQLSLSVTDELGSQAQDIKTLLRAIELHRQVELEYFSPQSRAARRRTMEPIQLSVARHHLYLRAYDLDRSEVREFRVDRVTSESVQLLPNKARHAPAPRRWTLKFRVMPELAPYGITRNLDNQREESQADGSVLVTGTIRSLFEGEWLLLRYGPGVECLAPAQLRAQMAEYARRMAEMYGTRAASRPGRALRKQPRVAGRAGRERAGKSQVAAG